MESSGSWKPGDYLRFEDERTRPCLDLVSRISGEPRTIIDLGCGPGNSTAVLRNRWPEAAIIGLDSSESMLDAARASGVRAAWVQGEISSWAAGDEEYDLVFSNAALQWVDDHGYVFPQLMRRVADGGLLALQVPADVNAPAHRIMREHFCGPPVREWFVHEPACYYDLLAPESSHLELWSTEYWHVLPGAEAIADWYRSTGLRPFLHALPTDEDRERFLRDYVERLRAEFPVRSNGRVLFPFRRLFLIARK